MNMDCNMKSAYRVCNKQMFILVNVVIVIINITFGLLMNLGSFTTQDVPRTLKSVSYNSLYQQPFPARPAFPTTHGLTHASGNYTYHGFMWPGKAWEDITRTAEVCLATHASPDRLYNLATHTRSFQGPISVAVFAADSGFDVAAEMIAYLRECVDGLEDRVSFHLVHPYENQPRGSKPPTPWFKCKDVEEFNTHLVAATGMLPYVRYPQNILRNLARRGCHAKYTLSIDMDMFPPPNMYPRLSAFLYGRQCQRCAYIVPVYEVKYGLDPPANKSSLLSLVSRGNARIYHLQVYNKNQGNSNLKKWEAMGSANHSPSAPYSILYNITKYQEYWEPVIVLPRGAPSFDERFIGYGFTRSSQIYELHMRKFNFSVLDEAFLVHLGFQNRSVYPRSRLLQISANRIRYQIFKRELHASVGYKPPPPPPPPLKKGDTGTADKPPLSNSTKTRRKR